MEEDDHRVYDLLRAEKEKELSSLKGLRKVKNALETPSSWTQVSANLCFKKSRLHRGGRRKSRKFSDNIGWDGLKYERGTRASRSEAVSKMQQRQQNELRELREMGIVNESLRRRPKQVRDDAKVLFDPAKRPYNLTKQANVLINSREPECDEAVAQFVKQTSHAFVEAFFGVPSQSQRVLERLTASKLHELEKSIKRQQSRKRRQARASDWELGYKEQDEDLSTADTAVGDRRKRVHFRSSRLETELAHRTITFPKRRTPVEVNGHVQPSVDGTDEMEAFHSDVSSDTVTSAPVTPVERPGWHGQGLVLDPVRDVVQEEDGCDQTRSCGTSENGDGGDFKEAVLLSTAPTFVSEGPPEARPGSLRGSESDCSDELRYVPFSPRKDSPEDQREHGFEAGTGTMSGTGREPAPQQAFPSPQQAFPSPQQAFPPPHPRGRSPDTQPGSDCPDQEETGCLPFVVVSGEVSSSAITPSALQTSIPKDEQICCAHELTSTSVEVYGEGGGSYKVQRTEYDSVFDRPSSRENLELMEEDVSSSSTSGSNSYTNLYNCIPSPLFSDCSALNTPFSESFAETGPFSWNGVSPEMSMAGMLRRRSQKASRGDNRSTMDDSEWRLNTDGLPPGAQNNLNFENFCRHLGIINPTRDHYTAYKLRRLGDDVDTKHEGLIEEFLQKAVIYAMQEKLSFQRFSKLSHELAVRAHRVTEKTLLVACFGRRLWEKLPEYQDNISQFTALSVEEIASDFFLSMGLPPDVIPYDPEICSDYDDWRDMLERLHSEDGTLPELMSEDPYFQMPLEEPPSYVTIPRGFNFPGRPASAIKQRREVPSPIDPNLSCLQLPGFHLRKAASVEVLLADSDGEDDRDCTEFDRDCIEFDGDPTVLPGRVKTDPTDERPSPPPLVKMEVKRRYEVTEQSAELPGASPRIGRSIRHHTSHLTDVRTFECGGHALEELDRGRESLSGPKPVIITSLSTISSVEQSVRTIGSLPSQSEIVEYAYREDEFLVNATAFPPRFDTPDEFPSTFTSSSSCSPDGQLGSRLDEQRDASKDDDTTSIGSLPSVGSSVSSPPRQRRRSSLQLVAGAFIPLAPAISAAVIALVTRSRAS